MSLEFYRTSKLPLEGTNYDSRTDTPADPVNETQKIVYRGSERMPGVILTVQSGLFEDGRQFALASGTTISREEDLEILRLHADAIANDAARPLFDPAQNAHDKVLEEEYKKLLCDRDEEELALKRSHATLAERKDTVARARSKVPVLPGNPSADLKTAAVAALAATIAPAAHDFLWTMDDELVSWSMSITTGVVFGFLITSLILGDNHHSGRRSLTNWLGLVAGLGIGIGLFLLRIKGAEGVEQIVFGVAMSVLEIAIVLFLEGLAISRRTALRERAPHETAANEAVALTSAQQDETNRRKQNVEELQTKIDAYGRYLEERHVRATYLKEIRETARKAVESGYAKGIAENRGIVTGVKL
ncbi:MAG: hypothetical protein ABR568_15015 [Pyrinomonadaceae bacterium]